MLEDTRVTVLAGITSNLVDDVKVGGFGAMDTTENVDYYLFQWMCEPYQLQQNKTWDDYQPPRHVEKGSWVARAKYWNPAPGAPKWYTPSWSHTWVLIKQVLNASVEMEPIGSITYYHTCLNLRRRQSTHAKVP